MFGYEGTPLSIQSETTYIAVHTIIIWKEDVQLILKENTKERTFLSRPTTGFDSHTTLTLYRVQSVCISDTHVTRQNSSIKYKHDIPLKAATKTNFGWIFNVKLLSRWIGSTV